MFIVEADIEDVLEELPLVKEWVDSVKTFILKKDFPTKKIKVFYTYGFFVAKSKNNENDIIDSMEMAVNMLYPERLAFERDKVRVDVSIKMGKFAMSNRLPKGVIPPFIDELIAEIVKIKMTVESEVSQNQEVIDSIPPLSGLVEFDIIDDIEEQIDFDMDDILDKISKHGLDSLTPEEKDFLDKKSKDV